MASQVILGITILALALVQAFAYDPSPLQDFCVADTQSKVIVNGFVCKDPKTVVSEDFLFRGLLNDFRRNTNNRVGSNVTQVNADAFPGLNTLGISLARIDYAPYGGLNPPHKHPRATEVLTVVEGTLHVGFIASNPANRFFQKVLQKGDVFVFPFGMIHFQMNLGHTPAVALSALSSQNPGVITIANAVFGSNPRVSKEVLKRAFQVDDEVVAQLMAQFN
ncbi:putative germin-like protein 2-1 [Asparagus officinalis]|uniref:putative germin-like protein 2-1 n=1 Tax=Asparagus officinalis TaxID=4686 RepID=UPI00098E57AB|nr:putative germin-like protein 2-1 [Asparagus officinalis]